MNAVARLKHGIVFFTQQRGCVLVQFNLRRFKPFATHACHVHEYGDLTEGCASLGGHYNPTGTQHGHHAGDLMFNIQADERGVVQYLFETDAFRVRDLYGRSVVIHELIDDKGKGASLYRYMRTPEVRKLCTQNGYSGARTRIQCVRMLVEGSKKTGNAGRRIDCAVIGRAA